MTIDSEASCLSDEAIGAWSSGHLAGDERERAIEHVASCDRCRAVLAHVVEPVAAPLAIASATAGGARRDVELGGGMIASPTSGGLRSNAERCGDTIGRYEIRGPLGSGGMGVVLRGHDPVLGREVAIKMIRANLVEPEHRERMLREAQAMARISHPNVVTVHEFGEAGDEVYVAMELVDGTMLQRWLAAAPRPPAERLAVALGVGRGVAAVHAADILHRDIKPDNIVVRGDGTPVLVDFGLARVTDATALGSGSGAAGTRHYLAPEIAAGKGATAASDQYQWWTIVEETLGERAQSPRIAAAIARGHDPDPGRRYPDQREAVAALERAAAPRRGRWFALAGAVLVAGVLAGGYALWGRPGGDPCEAARPAGWSLARRAGLAGHLRLAGVPPAKVLADLDARAEATGSVRAQACRATASGGPGRAEWARRQLCIDEAWTAVGGLIATMERPDAEQVRDAVDRMIEIQGPARCASGSLLARPEPQDAAARAEYERLGAQLQAIKAEPIPVTERVARLRALAGAVGALHYPPLEARWHYAIGQLLLEARDGQGPAEFDLAAQAALAAGDDYVHVTALIARLHGTPPTATDAEVGALERQAAAGARRLDDRQTDADLLLARADFESARAAHAKARPLYEQAAAIYDQLALAAHPVQMAIYQNLGVLCNDMGDTAAADRYLERAVELARQRYTPGDARYWGARASRAVILLDHKQLAKAESELRAVVVGQAAAGADTGVTRAFLCGALMYQDKLDEARAECAAAVAATRAAVGADGPGQVFELAVSGRVELRAKDPQAALGFLRRSLELAKDGRVGAVEVTFAQIYLAIALFQTRQVAAARALARRIAPALTGADLADERRDFLDVFPELTEAASPPAR